MIGTPHTRWREMHQSGRIAIMFEMRSSPHAGIHFTFLMASSACWRRLFAVHADEPLLGGAEDGRHCGSASSADSCARSCSWLSRAPCFSESR